jgi:hypothetical protein
MKCFICKYVEKDGMDNPCRECVECGKAYFAKTAKECRFELDKGKEIQNAAGEKYLLLAAEEEKNRYLLYRPDDAKTFLVRNISMEDAFEWETVQDLGDCFMDEALGRVGTSALQQFAKEEAKFRIGEFDYGIKITQDIYDTVLSAAADAIYDYFSGDENAINYDGLDQLMENVIKETVA